MISLQNKIGLTYVLLNYNDNLYIIIQKLLIMAYISVIIS